jgi:predicted GNAT superfamily acetyltransferase
MCEVNATPPNPASDAFHARLGFEEIGAAHLKKKTVWYFSRPVQR